MARTLNETRFAQALGRIGELELAPPLLRKMGLCSIRNLNETRHNHPWADYLGCRGGALCAVAVRTRVNYQKPRPGGTVLRLRMGFGGAGHRKAEDACRLIRADLGLPPSAAIELLWLAIAVELDDTFEAYWGAYEEMRPTHDGRERLTILMRPCDRERYHSQGRRLAWREPCPIPWEEYPDEWASVARMHSQPPAPIADRKQPLREAIRAAANTHAAPRDRTERLRRLEDQLASCRNPHEVEYFRSRIALGQQITTKGLSFRAGGLSRWCLDVTRSYARVVQKGRFAGDDAFWGGLLSKAALDGLGTKREGRFLVFRLVAQSDFAGFQHVVDCQSESLQWTDRR